MQALARLEGDLKMVVPVDMGHRFGGLRVLEAKVGAWVQRYGRLAGD